MVRLGACPKLTCDTPLSSIMISASAQFTLAERNLMEKKQINLAIEMKEALHGIFLNASGNNHGERKVKWFRLSDPDLGCCAILYVDSIRIDPNWSSFIADAAILFLEVDNIQRLSSFLTGPQMHESCTLNIKQNVYSMVSTSSWRNRACKRKLAAR
jgi:hypothetical protein